MHSAQFDKSDWQTYFVIYCAIKIKVLLPKHCPMPIIKKLPKIRQHIGCNKVIIRQKYVSDVKGACGTCEGEKGRILTGVLLGVMESLGSGERAMRRRLLRRLRMDGGVAPPGEMGISSPLLPLLSSCRVLPSRRNCSSSELWLSSGSSKSDIVHQPSRSLRKKPLSSGPYSESPSGLNNNDSFKKHNEISRRFRKHLCLTEHKELNGHDF